MTIKKWRALKLALLGIGVFGTGFFSQTALAEKPAPEKFNGSLYGQVNQAYVAVSNGSSSVAAVVNNQLSTTRIGYKGKYSGIEGITVGVKVELGLQNVSSNDITFHDGDRYFENPEGRDTGRDADGLVNIRVLDATISGDWGSVSIGQGPVATDKANEVDITGTKNIVKSSFYKSWGRRNLYFVADEWSNTTVLYDGAPAIGDLFNNFDGGRYARIRYDSNSRGRGTYVSISYSPSINCSDTTSSTCGGDPSDSDPATNNGSTVEQAQIKITAKYPGIMASVGHTFQDEGTYRSGTAGRTHVGISYFKDGADGGFGFAYSYGAQNYAARETAASQYIKFVWKKGNDSVSVDYALADSFRWTDPVDGYDKYLNGSSVGVTVGHIFDTVVHFYYGYRIISAEVQNSYDFNDISGYMIGALYKF